MKNLSIFVSLILILALFFDSVLTKYDALADSSGDIVGGTSDDIASGASVFVFRGSRKKMHDRNSARKSAFLRSNTAKAATRTKRLSQSATMAKKRSVSMPKARPASAEREAEILAAAGQKLLEQKNYDQAEVKFTEARKFNPNNQAAKDGLAVIMMSRGDKAFVAEDYKTAASFYERSLGFDGTNADAYASLGESYDELQMPEKAALAYENAYRLNDKLSSLVPTLASMFFEAGNYQKAQIYIEKALIFTPADAELQNRYGLVMLKLNRLTDAQTAFSNAAQLDPKFAEAHNNLGEVYDQTGNAAQAEAEYKEAIKQNPNFPDPYYNLGVQAYNRQQYAQAAEYYKKAIELKPDFLEAKANLADTYRQMEKFPEAVAVYKSAVAQDPNNPELLSKYGYCAGRAKDWNESREQLEKVAQLDGNGGTADDNTNIAWAYNNAGRDAQKKKDDANARANFTKGKEAAQKASDKDPNNAAAKFNLGDSQMSLGEAQAAVNTFRAVVGLRPDWAEAQNNLGLALNLLGDLAAAAGAFRTATGLNNNFFQAFANLAIVEYKRGNRKEGDKAKNRVEQLNPSYAVALNSYLAQYVLNKATQKVREKTIDKIRPKLPF
jgi:tetratricopeptide (TPR) repeat protein